MRSARVRAVLVAALAGLAGCAARPEIRYLPAGGSRPAERFEAGPLAAADLSALAQGEVPFERAAGLLAVRVAAEAGAPASSDLPAVAGVYRLQGDVLWFEPRFPLAPGVRYRAVFRGAAGAAVEREIAVPAPAASPTTTVEAMYPSAAVIPDNLLRFYIVFSASMSRGQVWRHLRLLDEEGKEVKHAFLELDEELWDRSFRRLTVLIDPGRIKRGLLPLAEVGPALLPEKGYTLEVGAGWEDAAGKTLAAPFRKRFRTAFADREPPDPASWKLSAPPAGTRQALAADLGEPLDHGLLHSALWVEGPDGKEVEGEISVLNDEARWSFTPAAPWRDAEHRLAVRTTLEDLAGNGVGRPFDVDVLEPVRRRIETDVVRLPFRPRAAAAPRPAEAPGAAGGR